jgi:hypothetical protein
MQRKHFLRWLRAMLIGSFGCLSAVGCEPGQIDLTPPSAGVDVTPASGGGGKVEPAEIPINVTVTVERRQADGPPIIINDRDEFADDLCECGCDKSHCDWSKSFDPQPQATAPRQASYPVTYDRNGWQRWTVNGTNFWMDEGNLAEGETDGTGRWQLQAGRMIDLHATPRQTTNTAPRYGIECVNGTCRRIRIN